VAAAFVLYGSLALIVTMLTRRLFPRILAWTVVAVLTTGVGLSRIYRGEHHPTDVIAGLALGAGALCVAALALPIWATRVARAADPAALAKHPEIAESGDTGEHSEAADDTAGVA
jgi:undecaprenyl-diphosphatase